jgi:DNA-binding response OmpR family regulator
VAGKILVLEDDRYILELVKDILGYEGHEVIGLSYPDLILDVVTRERPDAIVIDIMLPKVSGIEVADKLWLNGFASIPLIAMSASTVMADLARQTPLFCTVMRKPFDMAELLGAVDQALSPLATSTTPEYELQHRPAV